MHRKSLGGSRKSNYCVSRRLPKESSERGLQFRSEGASNDLGTCATLLGRSGSSRIFDKHAVGGP